MTGLRRIGLACSIAMGVIANGCGGGGTSTITPPPPPPGEVITITTNPNVTVVQNTPFTLTLQETGATTAVTWQVISGQLPSGLVLDSTTGIISGIPNSSTTAVIQAADSKASTSKPFNFNMIGQLTINPVTPPAAHLNVPFTMFISANSGQLPYTFSVSAGQLPPGLSLLTNQPNIFSAAISGTPTQLGSYTFTLQAQDSSTPQTAKADFTIVVDSHVVITKSTLKTGGQNQVFSDSFTAINGATPYHWSITDGQLPGGLSLNAATGAVSGTPTDFGEFEFTINVADSSTPQQTDSTHVNFFVAEQLQILTNLSPTYLNTSFSGGVYSIGGSFPVTFAIIAGNLPPGLTFSSNGIVQGVPTQLGSYPVTFQATDSGNPPYVVSKSVTMNVTPTPLVLYTSVLSPAPVNVVYHSQFPLSGGTQPYTWSIASGNLPSGITLDSASGFIDGTPTQIGTYNFQVKATDSSNPVQTTTVAGSIVIRQPLGRNDSLATATLIGNSFNLDQSVTPSISPYVDPINSAVGNPDNDYYKFFATSGSVVHVETNAQRAFNNDPIDNVIELLDENGNRLQNCVQPAYSSPCLNDDIDSTTVDSALDLKVPGAVNAQKTVFLHVLDWRGDARPDMRYFLNLTGAVDILNISVPTGKLGGMRTVSYQFQFSATGGTGSITWSVSSGSPPPGWTLSSSGLLSGAATADGNYSFTIQATDSGNPPQVATAQITAIIVEPLVITSSPTLPDACLNQPYSFTVTTSGGVPPYFYNFLYGAWPLVFPDPRTGTFSGTPTGAGTFVGTLFVSDSGQPTNNARQDVTLTVKSTCP